MEMAGRGKDKEEGRKKGRNEEERKEGRNERRIEEWEERSDVGRRKDAKKVEKLSRIN